MKHMNKELFERLWEKCKTINTVNFYYYDYDTEKVVDDITSCSPMFTIRDFEVESYPECDKDFYMKNDDINAENFAKNEAWKYLETLSFVRIMAVDGTILFDNYCD